MGGIQQRALTIGVFRDTYCTTIITCYATLIYHSTLNFLKGGFFSEAIHRGCFIRGGFLRRGLFPGERGGGRGLFPDTDRILFIFHHKNQYRHLLQTYYEIRFRLKRGFSLNCIITIFVGMLKCRSGTLHVS